MKRLLGLLCLAGVLNCREVRLNEGFEGSTFPPEGWSVVDHDGDTHKWELYDIANASHSGNYCAASFSVDYQNGYDPLHPQNYLITPKIAITEGMMLDFWAGSRSSAYPTEHLEVRISTAGAAPSDFTTLLREEQFSEKIWKNITVNLNQYAGQEVYVAFVHNSSTNQFALLLDDIQLTTTDLQAPVITEFENPSVFAGEELRCKIKISEANTVASAKAIYQIGTVSDSTYLTPADRSECNYLFIPPVQQSAVTGKVRFRLTDNLGNSALTDEYPLVWRAPLSTMVEGFENPVFPPADWSIIDHDGDGKNWEKYDLPVYVHSGELCAASFSSDYQNSQAPLQPDNYLITPRLRISSISRLTFFAGTQSNNYYAEPLEVRLSLTGCNYADFDSVLYSMVFDSVPDNNMRWKQIVVDFSQFPDTAGYLAFVHRSQEHNFAVKIDDINYTDYVGIEDQNGGRKLSAGLISHYPNPFNNSSLIKYRITTGETARITIYNARGEMVETASHKAVPGIYEHHFDGSRLNSGVYFCIYEHGAVKEKMKMILIK